MPSISAESLQHLLESGHAFAHPKHILEDIGANHAVFVPPNAVHSIASHTAHMAWWLRQALHLIETNATTWERIEGEEFPQTIPEADWDSIRSDFFTSLERLKAICEDAALLERPYVSGKNTVGYVVLDFALHNAYHMGQIVLLKRLQGIWQDFKG
ncbi:MAG: DinB family protein [Deinococcales bacterium]